MFMRRQVFLHEGRSSCMLVPTVPLDITPDERKHGGVWHICFFTALCHMGELVI